MKGTFLAAKLFFGLTASLAHAGGDVYVADAVLSAATTHTRPTAIFFDMVNDGDADAGLVSVATPLCGRAELHDHIREGDVLKMRAVQRIPVPAGATVRLKPMGLHVMCFDPVLPQVPGRNFPLTLTFESGSAVEMTGKIITFDQAIRRGGND